MEPRNYILSPSSKTQQAQNEINVNRNLNLNEHQKDEAGEMSVAVELNGVDINPVRTGLFSTHSGLGGGGKSPPLGFSLWGLPLGM